MQSADYWAKEHLQLLIRTWVPLQIDFLTLTIMPFLEFSLSLCFPFQENSVRLNTIYLAMIDCKCMQFDV